MSAHDKAIEAAKMAYNVAWAKRENSQTVAMRRAIAAFLRAWEPAADEDGCPPLDPKTAARMTADELDGGGT